MSPGQVLTDVDPEEPEPVDSLHRSPIDEEGGVSFSLPLPVIHDHLLCFADVEMEVVVLALICQGSDLLSVSHLQADDGRVISRLDDGVGAVGGHTVIREQGEQDGAEYAALRGACLDSQGGGCGAAYQHSLTPTSLSLVTSLEGTMVLNAELQSMNRILTYVSLWSRWEGAVWMVREMV